MPANVGSLIVEIAANTARLQRDMGKANRIMQTNARSMQRMMQGVGIAAGAIFSARTLDAIADAADAYSQVQNKLKLVTKSSYELSQVQEKLFSVSQKARAGFESTVDLYSRIARSTDALGASQEDTLKVTDAISKAFVVSGASAQEASAAVVQLGQGLASGALRGDELRSVLEQAPRLAKAIADGLGVSIGELRELGSEGELTAEKVFNALLGQADKIGAEFSKLDPTIGQALGNMGNSAINLVGKLDDILNASSAVSKGILSISESIDEFSKGLSENSPWIVRFGEDLARVIFLAGQVDAGNLGFFEWLTMGKDEAKDYVDNLSALSIAKRKLAALEASELSIYRESNEARVKQIELAKEQVRVAEVMEAQKRKQLRREAWDSREVELPSAAPREKIDKDALKKSAADQLRVKEWLATESINLIEDEYARRIAAIRKEAEEQRVLAHGRMELIQQINAMESQQIGAVNTDRAKEAAEKEIERRKKLSETIAEERKVLMTENQREISDLRERYAEQLRVAEKYGFSKAALVAQQEQEISRLLNDQHMRALRESKKASDGMTVAFKDYADSVSDMASQMGTAVNTTLVGIEDFFVNFATTGKFTFKDMTNSIIADLARITARKAVTGPIASALGDIKWSDFFHGGGIVGTDSPTFRRPVDPSVFAGAQRFHNGLMPDEFPAILQKGEMVIPKNAVGGSAGGASTQTVTINIKDSSGKQLASSQNVDVSGMKNTILDIVWDAMSRNEGGRWRA